MLGSSIMGKCIVSFLHIIIMTITFLLLIIQSANAITIIEKPEKECAFVKVNKDLNLVISKLLNLLNANSKISNNFKVELLIALNKHLIRLAELKMKTYRKVANASKTDIENNTFAKLYDVENLVQEAISENIITIKDTVKNETTNIITVTTLQVQKNNRSYGNKSTYNDLQQESLEFVKSFLHKIDKLTIQDILGPYVKEKENEILLAMSKILSKAKKVNLKKWDPVGSSEETFTHLNNTRRLYGGDTTSNKNYPFMASIHVDGMFVCSASIISKDLVITAAACLQIVHNNSTLSHKPSVYIRVTSDYTNKLGKILPVTNVYFHPEFDPQHLKNNLAIAQVDEMKNIKDKKIRRILLERREIWISTEGTIVKMLGWGDKEPNVKNQGDPLSLTRIPIYNFQECQDRYTGTFVTTKNYCGGFTDKGGGACNRDIGGPGIVDGALTGVVSFGPPVCGTPDAPTVFTDVTQHLDWIYTVLQKDETSTAEASSSQLRRNKPDFLSIDEVQAKKITPIRSRPQTTKSSKITGTSMKAKTHALPLFPENIKLIERAFKEADDSNVKDTDSELGDIMTEDTSSDKIDTNEGNVSENAVLSLSTKYDNNTQDSSQLQQSESDNHDASEDTEIENTNGMTRQMKPIYFTQKITTIKPHKKSKITKSIKREPNRDVPESIKNLMLLYGQMKTNDHLRKAKNKSETKTTPQESDYALESNKNDHTLSETNAVYVPVVKKSGKYSKSPKLLKAENVQKQTQELEQYRWIVNKKVIEKLNSANNRQSMQYIINEIYGDDYEVEYVSEMPKEDTNDVYRQSTNDDLVKSIDLEECDKKDAEMEDSFYFESDGDKEVNYIDEKKPIKNNLHDVPSKAKLVINTTPNSAEILDSTIKINQNIDIDVVDERDKKNLQSNEISECASDNFETAIETDSEGISIEMPQDWKDKPHSMVLSSNTSLSALLLKFQLQLLSSQNDFYYNRLLTSLGLL